jgi:hypothetical protein
VLERIQSKAGKSGIGRLAKEAIISSRVSNGEVNAYAGLTGDHSFSPVLNTKAAPAFSTPNQHKEGELVDVIYGVTADGHAQEMLEKVRGL